MFQVPVVVCSACGTEMECVGGSGDSDAFTMTCPDKECINYGVPQTCYAEDQREQSQREARLCEDGCCPMDQGDCKNGCLMVRGIIQSVPA